MNRRFFVKALAAAVAVASIPFSWPVVPTVKRGPLTIAQILSVAWPAAVNEMCRGGYLGSIAMKLAWHQKRVSVATISGLAPNIKLVRVPIVWSVLDDIKNNTEAKKIAICKTLIENAIESLDDCILEEMGEGNVIVSREYRYDLSPVYQPENFHGYVAYVSTVVQFVPKEDDNGNA